MEKAARVKRTAFFPVTMLITAAGLRHHPSPVPAGQA
jgi:hypothetical protein